MARTIQHPKALEAADILHRRHFSIIGNPELQKLRIFRAHNGKQIAIVLENKTLTVVTEPIYDPASSLSKFHKKRYEEHESRHADLSFHDCRLGLGYRADWWTFPTATDFEDFVKWYVTQ